MRRTRSVCCARAASGHAAAAEQRDELAPFQLIELHSVPARAGLQDIRIGKDELRSRAFACAVPSCALAFEVGQS